MIDSIYHCDLTFKINLNFWRVNVIILSLCTQRFMAVITYYY